MTLYLVFFYLAGLVMFPLGSLFWLYLLGERLFAVPIVGTSAMFAPFLTIMGLQSRLFLWRGHGGIMHRYWACAIRSFHPRGLGALDKQRLEARITTHPGQCGGRPCIRGMRIRVADILEMLAEGVSAEEILSDFPDLEAEDIQACLHFAARRADIARLVA